MAISEFFRCHLTFMVHIKMAFAIFEFQMGFYLKYLWHLVYRWLKSYVPHTLHVDVNINSKQYAAAQRSRRTHLQINLTLESFRIIYFAWSISVTLGARLKTWNMLYSSMTNGNITILLSFCGFSYVFVFQEPVKKTNTVRIYHRSKSLSYIIGWPAYWHLHAYKRPTPTFISLCECFNIWTFKIKPNVENEAKPLI